jgi:hypothetical protein
MRVLVCGGRNYADERFAFALLDRIDAEHEIAAVIHGGAGGADAIGRNWTYHDCNARGVERERICFPANWSKHGNAAGPIRNQQMLDEGGPDLVVAFPGGRGTADMVRRANAAGVRVMRVRP